MPLKRYYSYTSHRYSCKIFSNSTEISCHSLLGKKGPVCSTKIKGFSLIESTVAILLSAILILGINGVLDTAIQANQQSSNQNESMQQAHFAMQQMVRAVTRTQRLLIPLGENPNTAWSESLRNVLAVTLDPTLDRDKDGWADANNDKDFLDINNNTVQDIGEPERIDEDFGNQNDNDGAPGIIAIDDDGDGLTDEGNNPSDDDEDGVADEDNQNSLDDDNDGSTDEDMAQDMNKDNMPGIKDFDDDYDGTVDEGNNDDDDEDGLRGEDWLDPVVFFLNGTTLMQRIPNINPADGTDYSEHVIAENISQLQFERLTGNDGHTLLVNISLTHSPADAEAVTLTTRVRVGAGL